MVVDLFFYNLINLAELIEAQSNLQLTSSRVSSPPEIEEYLMDDNQSFGEDMTPGSLTKIDAHVRKFEVQMAISGESMNKEDQTLNYVVPLLSV